MNAIEQQFGTRKISELGGIAQKAPVLTILLVVVALANVAMPLTNAFIGEFMMFNGVLGSTASQYSVIYAVAAGLTIILGAVYTLRMIQRVFYGELNTLTMNTREVSGYVQVVLSIIVVAILVIGVYPKPFLSLTSDVSQQILNRMILK